MTTAAPLIHCVTIVPEHIGPWRVYLTNPRNSASLSFPIDPWLVDDLEAILARALNRCLECGGQIDADRFTTSEGSGYCPDSCLCDSCGASAYCDGSC